MSHIPIFFIVLVALPAQAANPPQQQLPAAVKQAPAAQSPAQSAAQPAALPAAQPAAAQPAAATVKYNLRNLKPVGMSGQNNGDRRRELLQFTNEQGKQNILYEEATAHPTLKEIVRLAPFLASATHTCSVDLECKAKAFCTDNCRSLYYELSNNPSDPALADKSNCVLQAFTCLTEAQAQRAVAAQTAAQPGASTPAPAPAPAKGP